MKKDDLAGDLLAIIEDSRDEVGDIDQEMLMTRLVPFITRRDHTVWNHAYKIGKAKANEEAENQKEEK